MKKILVVLIVALVALTSVSAFRVKSIGIETGNGYYASLDMEIVKNLEVYARVGYNGMFATSGGINYKVSEFKLNGTPVYIKPGAQIGVSFRDSLFNLTVFGACDFSFETSKLSAFVRPGCGLHHNRIAGENYYNFVFFLEAGVAYLL